MSYILLRMVRHDRERRRPKDMAGKGIGSYAARSLRQSRKSFASEHDYSIRCITIWSVTKRQIVFVARRENTSTDPIIGAGISAAKEWNSGQIQSPHGIIGSKSAIL